MTGTLPYVILDPYIEADLQYLLANSGGGGSGSTYDIAMEYTGGPPASTNILVFNAVRPYTLVAGLAGSYFTCQTAPGASTVFTILQNATTIGTITFASGATSGTASFTSGVTFATGDELIIQSPASANGLLTLAITFKGTTTTTGGASTIVVEQGGTSVVPTATTLNFTGTNVTVTNPGSGVANINITANPSITVGSTVVVGGTAGNLLYDTGGTVGETNAPTVSLTNATGLSLTTGVTGLLPVANGGTGTATPSIVGGTNVTVTGSWPNQTISASGGGGSSINVQQAGSTVVTGLTVLNFASGATVTASGTTANVAISGGGGGGSNTLIAQHICGAGESSYTFSSIPQTWVDIELVVNGNVTGSSIINPTVTVNGLSTAIYSQQRTYSNNYLYGAPQSDGSKGATSWGAQLPAFSGTGSSGSYYPSSMRIRLYNYTNTTFYKAGEFQGVQKYQSTDGEQFAMNGNLYVETASAITSITFSVGSAVFATGTILTLLGIGG